MKDRFPESNGRGGRRAGGAASCGGTGRPGERQCGARGPPDSVHETHRRGAAESAGGTPCWGAALGASPSQVLYQLCCMHDTWENAQVTSHRCPRTPSDSLPVSLPNPGLSVPRSLHFISLAVKISSFSLILMYTC